MSSRVLLMTAALLAQIQRPGVAPDTPWSCPADHPVKGYQTTAARRLYYMPGDRFYEEASPDRCYATADEAQRDGARAPTRGRLTPTGPV